MAEERTKCDFNTPDDGGEAVLKGVEMSTEQPIFSALSGGQAERDTTVGQRASCEGTKAPGAAPTPAPTPAISDTESGIFSGECETCVEHESELDWFCGTELKLICSHCAIVGPCRGHSVTPLADRVTAVRNQLVDACEKMQVQARWMERFMEKTLPSKEQKLQVAASTAREQVVAQVNAAREALEEEEQRLLEEVQREEERVEQCLLTQRAHWSQALDSLAHTRSLVVHTLTHYADPQLVMSIQEFTESVEAAEGVGKPCDTKQLNFRPGCGESKLLRGLWATAMLQGRRAYGSSSFKFDERTVSPLLSLSDDHRTLTFVQIKPSYVHKKLNQSLPYDPARFDSWPNALGSLAMSSGTHTWVLDVGQSAAFKVGVCYASMERKGAWDKARLGYNEQSWVLCHFDGEYSFCHQGNKVLLEVMIRPRKVGLLLDWPSQTLLFYSPESSAVLYTVRGPFNAPLLPAVAVTDQSVTILH
ncbi:B box and SPRY domain-containing protein isoform X1 [Entelurus aequoreus]|uniref:B box and SPRY domain-containing protein isoform X1 n=1 Tax=Entelurus aequoreus TaxID=161455 RepID=UPI002B1E83F9|nr:B box and SPRY domain-containing protein isoform X1 [Entelurus aequoreus]